MAACCAANWFWSVCGCVKGGCDAWGCCTCGGMETAGGVGTAAAGAAADVGAIGVVPRDCTMIGRDDAC